MEKAQTFHHGHPTSPTTNNSEPANLAADEVKKTRARTFSQPRKLHLRSRHGGSGNVAAAHHALGISGTGSKTSSTAALISTALTAPLQVLPDSFRRGVGSNSAAPSRRTSFSSSRDPAPQPSTSAAAPTLSPIGSPSMPSTGFKPSLTTRLLAYPPNISLAPPRHRSAIANQQNHLSSLLPTRENDLTTSLAALTSAALAATRRLDTAYDELLARGAALTSALTALRELHSSLSSSRENFDIRVTGLQGEADNLVAGYRDFEDPEKRVTALVDRLSAAKERSVVAEEKLEALKERVGRWEKREKKRSRERWWAGLFGGGIAGVIVVAILAYMWISQSGPIEHVASPVGVRLADDVGGSKRDAQWKRVLDEL